MSPPVVQVRGLRVTYRDRTAALRGVDLDLVDGERAGVVGESGSGKTTLTLALLALLTGRARMEGSVRVGDVDVGSASERTLRRMRGATVGYVAQDPYAAGTPVLSVGRSVGEAWTAHGRRPRPGEVVAALDAVHIADAADRARRRPAQWSGGMLQRAAIAAALAHDPPLVVADEPTSALDADLADAVLAELARRSRSLLLVSHDLRLVAAHTDVVHVLYAGRIVESGPSRRVLDRPRHPYTRALLAATPDGVTLPTPIPGTHPDLRRPDHGCAFAPRCERVLDRCTEVVPALVDGVACIRDGGRA